VQFGDVAGQPRAVGSAVDRAIPGRVMPPVSQHRPAVPGPGAPGPVALTGHAERRQITRFERYMA